MASFEERVSSIEASRDENDLRNVFQSIIENYGFSSFGFVDASHPWQADPLLITTHSKDWIDTYRRDNFLSADPCLSAAKRTNTPFAWSSVKLPKVIGRRKPLAVKTMEAARDFGINEGLTIPFHYNDHLGRRCSSICAFFWKDNIASFDKAMRSNRYQLHLLLIYFAQRMVDFRQIEVTGSSRRNAFLALNNDRPLTDREKEVLTWSGMGKTNDEISDILNCSAKTVDFHLRNAMLKLGASNKGHAAVKATYLGLIDVG